jgi:glycosyltransferase involved in cell wall biosynthesis
MKFSTQKNISFDFPAAKKGNIVGKYLYYPNIPGDRICHGGLRMHGKFKRSMPDKPLVTVITVCRNSETTLEQCICSVLKQSYENIEYIIVDGASTDSTMTVINRYKDAIDYYVSEPDRGLYHAMNKGLELAQGAYVLFLNSDDWYELECIESLWVGLCASGADFSCALTTFVDKDGKAIKRLPKMPFNESIRFGMSIRHELMFVSERIYNQIGGYDERYKIIADFDLAVRIYDKGYTLYEINRPLLNFRTSGVSNTNWPRLVIEHRELLFSQFPEINLTDLEPLSDPRRITADLIDQSIASHLNYQKYVESLLSYGYRRGLFSIKRPSAHYLKQCPRVSVIVPVYNSANTLGRCINSALSQSISDIEVICIDDGSSDQSSNLLSELSNNDPRIRFIHNSTNLGVAATRNIGVANAKGEYCFFLDADDEIIPGGLEKLVYFADLYRSDIVRGTMEKVQDSGRQIFNSLIPPNGEEIINTTVFDTPALLATSEGFTTCLYRRSLVQNCRFIEGMSMGEDSLFLINSFLYALSISWINQPVYRYHQHSNSAMSQFGFVKYLDAIEWRERAWLILSQQGMHDRADFFAFKYWNPDILTVIRKQLSRQELDLVFMRLNSMLKVTQFDLSKVNENDAINIVLRKMQDDSKIAYKVEAAPITHALKSTLSCSTKSAIRVGVFNTFDRGGAATGSIRRIAALRDSGVNATLHPLVSSLTADYLKPLVPKPAQDPAWQKVHQNSILCAKNELGFQAMELFSLPYSVIDYTKYTKLISEFDVLHLHWVVGILDYQNAGDVLGDKPVVWTLADMNPFTGGCHYSEGCEEYQRECKRCPLLGGSNLAHEGWQTKRDAYAKIKNLEIICPSSWMAERVKKSSLLGSRVVHVVPNAYPINDFTPQNKIVARLKLGLPLDKRLILFGADSLNNKRKGGDLLAEALQIFKATNSVAENTEVVTYGNHSINLPLPTHFLGFIKTNSHLNLAYSACDVYAFPSREDNAPLTVGEALLCGTPVVAFPVGNVPELIKHKMNGYIASYGDVSDLAEGMRWAVETIDRKKMTKMSSKCRMVAEIYHSPTLAAERHIEIYRRLLQI